VIRICTAQWNPDGYVSSVLGDLSKRRTLICGETSIFMENRALERKWQYTQKGRIVVDISDVFEGVFSDEK